MLARLERKRKGEAFQHGLGFEERPRGQDRQDEDGTTHGLQARAGGLERGGGGRAARGTPTLSKTLAKAGSGLDANRRRRTRPKIATDHSRTVLRALNAVWKTRIAAPSRPAFRAGIGDEAARRAVTNNRARLKSGVAPKAEIVERRPQPRSTLACAQTIPAGRPQSIVTDAQLIGAGTPREAVARRMAVFSVCSRTEAMWWHGGARRDGFRRRNGSPHNQRQQVAWLHVHFTGK